MTNEKAMSKGFLNSPSEAAISDAKNIPNGYIYIVDREFADSEQVPYDKIKGAWQVNDRGIIVRDFIPNPVYRKTVSRP